MWETPYFKLLGVTNYPFDINTRGHISYDYLALVYLPVCLTVCLCLSVCATYYYLKGTVS